MNHKFEFVPTFDVDSIIVRIFDTNDRVIGERFCLATEHGVYLPEWEDSNPDIDMDCHEAATEYFSSMEKYQLDEDSPRNLRKAATYSGFNLSRTEELDYLDYYDL